jgi:hypothetical protein
MEQVERECAAPHRVRSPVGLADHRTGNRGKASMPMLRCTITVCVLLACTGPDEVDSATEGEDTSTPGSASVSTSASASSSDPGLDSSSSEAVGSTDGDTSTTMAADSSTSTGSGSCSDDLASDPENCGSCGHGCLGGACTAGLCQPIVLHNGAAHQGLMVDDTHVYFANYELVMRIDKTGGAAQELAPVMANIDDGSLQLNTTHAYWVESWEDYDSVVRVAKAGGPREDVVPSMNADEYAIDDERIYYNDGGLHSIPLDGGDVTVHDSLYVYSLGIDDTYVYVGDESSLERMHKRTGETETIVPVGVSPHQQLLARDGRLFWQEANAPFADCLELFDVRAVDNDGGDLQTIASLGLPDSLAVSDDAVYVAACEGSYDGILVRIPHGGAPEEVVPAPMSSPRHVAADDDAIYWVDGFNLYRLAK